MSDDKLPEIVPDPVETGMVFTAVWAVQKVLGPALDVIGESFAGVTRRRLENLATLADAISRRVSFLGSTDHLTGVDPRLAAKVIEEASCTDDAILREYFAGMLISASAADLADHDGIYYFDLMSKLSPEVLRLHHAIYRRMYEAKGTHYIAGHAGRTALAVFAPVSVPTFPVSNTVHSIVVLEREGLVANSWIDTKDRQFWSSLSNEEMDPLDWAPGDTKGLHAQPQVAGARLFLYAYGLGSNDARRFGGGPPLPSIELELPEFGESFMSPEAASDTPAG